MKRQSSLFNHAECQMACICFLKGLTMCWRFVSVFPSLKLQSVFEYWEIVWFWVQSSSMLVTWCCVLGLDIHTKFVWTMTSLFSFIQPKHFSKTTPSLKRISSFLPYANNKNIPPTARPFLQSEHKKNYLIEILCTVKKW